MSSSKVAPSAGFLPALKDFVYQPWTNWEGLFQGWFSPSINFGGNVHDKPVEEQVLSEVGSYGKQLNCIFDSLSVLISRIDHKDLTPAEEYAVYKFQEMARLAEEVVNKFEGKPHREGATLSDVDNWVDAVLALKASNPDAYERLSARMKDSLPPIHPRQ
jgi:hypothetical protein